MCSASQRDGRTRCNLTVAVTSDNGVDRTAHRYGDTAMKTIVSTLIALSILAGIAGPLAALDTKAFYEQQDRARF